MNKKVLIVLIMVVNIFSGRTMAASHPASETNSNNIIQIQEVNDEILANLTQELLIFELTEGASIPVKLFLKGDVFELESTSENAFLIKTLKTIYFKKAEGAEFLFSHDLEIWKGFFEFFKGSLNINYSVREGEGAFFDVTSDLNTRE